MNIPKTTARNKVKSIKKRLYNNSMKLLCIPVGTNATRNAIENMANTKPMFNINSKNFVSISYCVGILIIKLF